MNIGDLVSHVEVVLKGRAALEATVRYGQRHLGSAKWEPEPGSEAAAELATESVNLNEAPSREYY